jgi:hypothetical protein
MLSPMPNPRCCRSVALLLPLASIAWLAVGLSAGRAPQGAGTATLPFRVLGSDGQPITDLKAADVSLKVDGRAREVKSFELVDLRKAPGAAEASAPKSDAPSPYASNASAGGSARDIYVLVDEESIAPGKEGAVKDAIGHLIAARGPQDRVAVLSIRQGGANVAPSDDLTKVKAAVASLAGYGSGSADLTCRTVRVIQTLQAVFSNAPPGIPPTVVFFSAQVAALQAGRTANVGGVSGSQLCEIRTEQMHQLGSAAQLSRASFYVVELTDSGTGARPAEAAGGLENLAGSTHGEIIRVSTNADTQMKRIATGTSAYYVVGFEPEGADRSAGNKRVELTVARGGLDVKAPREMSFARAGAAKGTSANPRDMIRSATAYNDLPLRAAAYSSRNPGDAKIRILALFEPVEPGTKLTAAMVGLFDANGKLTAQWTAQAADLANPTAMAALIAPAGAYRMRVAATDASGKSGAVDAQVSLGLVAAGPIQLGDLVLGKIVQGSPLPALQFSAEEEAVAIVELYGRPAGPLKMYAELLGAGDPIQVPLAPAATSEQDKFLLTAKVPVGALKPGDYTVRAIVAVEGQPEAQVSRTLRKVKQ